MSNSLHLDDFRKPGHVYHFARTRLSPSGVIAEHGHDFAELFCIEAGRGTYLERDSITPLTKGFVKIVAPGDVHSIRAQSTRELVLANVAFPASLLSGVRSLTESTATLDGPAQLSRDGYQVSSSGLDGLRLAFGRLVAGANTELELYRFLFEVHALTASDAQHRKGRAGMPHWLSRAIATVKDDPDQLALGPKALARHAGKSPDHLNRVCRRVLGSTATELITELRLDRAEFLLQGSTMDVTSVAYESGFANLSHFYRCFQRRLKMTPRLFRDACQTPVRTRSRSNRSAAGE